MVKMIGEKVVYGGREAVVLEVFGEEAKIKFEDGTTDFVPVSSLTTEVVEQAVKCAVCGSEKVYPVLKASTLDTQESVYQCMVCSERFSIQL